ncbi:MAG: Calx-beta domain-containing protein [Bacteroidota bacterium]
MRTYSTLLVISVVTLFISGLLLSSCNKDEVPPAKPQLSFTESSMTVNESDGEIEVKLALDKPTSERFYITYELDGTATDKVNAGTNPYDYEIKDDYLEAKIDKDDTVAIIKIQLYSDSELEDDETIQISIKSVDSENIEITREDDIKITINQEDGMIVVLEWPAQNDTAKADMDLLLRAGANTSTWDGILTGSVNQSFDSPEFIFIPIAVNFAAYGLSYVYYDGSFDPLDFTATFIDVVNGTPEAANLRQSFDGEYTIANINAWTDPSTTIVVQTFEKVGTEFKNISDIDEPATGSRLNTSSTSGLMQPSLVKKSGNPTPSKLMLQLINELK